MVAVTWGEGGGRAILGGGRKWKIGDLNLRELKRGFREDGQWEKGEMKKREKGMKKK